MGLFDFLKGKKEPIQTEEETRQVMEEAEIDQENADRQFSYIMWRYYGEGDD